MKPGPAILLRCFLAFAMVTGSIPALGMSDEPASTDIASEAIADGTDGTNPGCHSDSGENSPKSASASHGDDCCSEKDDDCTHEKCDCVCPALTIVVPTRTAPGTLTIVRAPYSALTVPAPQKVITTPLRPPRA